MDIKKRLGWKRGLPEPKPFQFFPQRGLLSLPESVDLSSQFSPVYDQNSLGSCTSNAAAGMLEFLMKKQKLQSFTPSRLAIYYWTRLLEKTVNEDSGCSLSDTMKTIVSRGAPHESLWTYDISKFKVKPNQTVVNDAANHKLKAGLSVSQDLLHMKACLAEGYPFIFGFTVFSSFESDKVAKSGICPMPSRNDEVLGGHAVCAVSYNNNKRMFKIRNSWGKDWGLNGYFWMPYDYITNRNLADDFWTGHEFGVWKNS